MRKLFTIALAVGLAVSFGTLWGCGGDDNGESGGDLNSLDPAPITAATVEDMVGDALELLSPYGEMGMGLSTWVTGGMLPVPAPPRPQATYTEGCMTFNLPDDFMTATSFSVTIELDNCEQSSDGISGSGTIDMTFSASNNIFNVTASVDITDGSDFVEMNITINGTSAGTDAGTMAISMDGVVSAPDGSGEVYYIDVTENVEYDVDDYLIEMNGDFGSSSQGRMSIVADGLSFSLSQCSGEKPYAGTVTVSNGTDTAVVSIIGCGAANLTINGADQGMIHF